MERRSVNSSNIAAIGYDPERQILEVEFNSGSVYHYLGVPEHLHLGLMSADSHGRFLNQHIKEAGFPYIQVQ